MRIQHNIAAMNSYRNFSTNNAQLSKNLEKLSSGYKINRAGDDAAGLAISEKMRAQITGLTGATKNAKDGISLIQTAEGALTEVHDMLNRMTSLAEQSANGTYDNSVDRAQLQKEVESLKSEIDRVADSTNYNGIKLLDGSLEKGGTTGIDVGGNAEVTITAGTKGSLAMGSGMAISDVFAKEGTTLKLNMVDDKGNSFDVSLTRDGENIVDNNTGKSYAIGSKWTTGQQAKFNDAVKSAIESATGGAYKATVASDSLTIESADAGTRVGTMKAIGGQTITASGTATAVDLSKATQTMAAATKVKVSGVTAVTAGDTAQTAKSNIFTVNGQKFVLAADSDASAVKALVDDDVDILLGAGISDVAGQLEAATGLKTTKGSAAVEFESNSGKGLNLQIGDTAQSFNRLSVSINDMHTSALGISGIDISTQDGAAAAMSLVKDAINKVSDTRGGLGALQNRLDHTINNLGVMTENITNAESSIRDTDVAEEMMKYTKNNILNQSAQAMLAQANQLPQGVLQLLG